LKKPFIISILLLIVPAVAWAEVAVPDDVAVAGEAVMLSARTKGFIMPRGGEIVEFKVDSESLGRNLSGGDGWAYREFKPKKEKLYKVEAASGGETGAGFLLALRKGRGIVFVDVQGALVKPPFSREPREGSLDSIKKISEGNHIVYLYTELPGVVIRAWLEENEFPEAPLLSWRVGYVFDDIVDKGLKVKAVVGSAAVVESAFENEGAKLFTFEPSDEATEVDSWEEVEKGVE
jgi:hypothetical protein